LLLRRVIDLVGGEECLGTVVGLGDGLGGLSHLVADTDQALNLLKGLAIELFFFLAGDQHAHHTLCPIDSSGSVSKAWMRSKDLRQLGRGDCSGLE